MCSREGGRKREKVWEKQRVCEMKKKEKAIEKERERKEKLFF